MSILKSTSSWDTNEGVPAVSDLDLKQAEHLRAARLLCDLLVQAGDAALAPIAWTVTRNGNLVGRILGPTDAMIRYEFRNWLNFLGAQRLDDDRCYFGTLILRGAVIVQGREVRLYAYLDASGGGRR